MTEDALRSLEDLEAAVPRPLHGGVRWQIRDEDAVLCLDLPGARVELTPRGRRRCELRVELNHATLRRLLRALENERPGLPAASPVDVLALEPAGAGARASFGAGDLRERPAHGAPLTIGPRRSSPIDD